MHKQQSGIIPDITQVIKNDARHSQCTYWPDHQLDVQAITLPFLAHTTDFFYNYPYPLRGLFSPTFNIYNGIFRRK